MKITIINGNARHGSTWHCAELIAEELERITFVHKTVFTLPRDMPHFCCGCFSCFNNGEETCPHAKKTSPIIAAILEADLIILTSPVYGMDVTGQMKALLDHLCFMWLSHRPAPTMFGKLGLVVATTAGAGLGHTVKTMKNSLTFWGVRKIFVSKHVVAASSWNEVSDKKQEQIRKAAVSQAKQIVKAANRGKRLPVPIFQKFMFKMMASMMKKNDWNPRDRKHWEEQGWLKGKSPF